jgi:16S rRNA (guanine966-N2)-methyltransferase
MESVREAVFSSLGGNCEGQKVLDLFAGSGALGMEAWSRSADSVTFVEKSSNVWKNLENNIQSLESDELGKTKCIKSDAIKWLSRAGTQFDLILADPPYDLPDAMENTLEGIVKYSVLKADGILVYEMRSRGEPVISNDWKIIRDKKYGKTRVLILKLKTEE